MRPLVPAQDAEALSRALLCLLRDPALSRQLVATGRQRATHDFSFEQMIREVGELYKGLLRRHEGRY